MKRRLKFSSDKMTGNKGSYTLFAIYWDKSWYPPSFQLYLFNWRFKFEFPLRNKRV